MKPNEIVMVTRTQSGLYEITKPDGTKLIGSAASTAIGLITTIFLQEASELPGEWEEMWSKPFDYPERLG